MLPLLSCVPQQTDLPVGQVLHVQQASLALTAGVVAYVLSLHVAVCLAEHGCTDAASACRVEGPSVGLMESAPVQLHAHPPDSHPHPPAGLVGL